MTRDIRFVAKGQLPTSLGIPEDRTSEIESFIADHIERDASTEEIILALNERGDLTDAEWTSTMFALGHYVASIGR